MCIRDRIVKGIRNFENKVTVTLALQDKERFEGEIFDLDISLDRVEGAAREFYEAAARRSIRQVFLDVAAGLCEGDEQSPEKRPVKMCIRDRDKRRRDLDNILKAPLDALTHAGVLMDDEQFDEINIVRGQPCLLYTSSMA